MLGTEIFFPNFIHNKIFYNIKNKKNYVVMIRWNNLYEVVYEEKEFNASEQQKIMTYD